MYITEDGVTRVDVTFVNETVWLTQEQMAELFQKSKSTINEHIKNIYLEGELQQEETMRKFGNSEFSTKPTNYYNLDVIISMGYRVKSQRGVQFRIWATSVLKEYMLKGFTMDDERLKGNRELLVGSGHVSHKQALDKAKNEYRKYQEITIAPVEQSYLESMKEVSKKAKKSKQQSKT